MITIDPKVLGSSGLTTQEMFFVELWNSLTHEKSLDSYRVKCMNSRIIIKELSNELHFHLTLIRNDEIKMICEEAQYILQNDLVCKKHFSNFNKTILPYLEKPLEKPKKVTQDTKDKSPKDGKDETKIFQQFCFIVEDYKVALERNYFLYLCNDLVDSIQPNNEQEIYNITSSLLSDLVDRGWPLGVCLSNGRLAAS
jgi:hypothetical protein